MKIKDMDEFFFWIFEVFVINFIQFMERSVLVFDEKFIVNLKSSLRILNNKIS